MASKSICVVEHPPYSPDLAPAHFFLFPKVKCASKRERFSDIADVQHSVTNIPKEVPVQDFHATSDTLHSHDITSMAAI